MEKLLERAISEDMELKKRNFEIKETDALFRYSGGDARKFLNIIDLIVNATDKETILIDDAIVTDRLQQNPAAYDKGGEMHYDIIYKIDTRK